MSEVYRFGSRGRVLEVLRSFKRAAEVNIDGHRAFLKRNRRGELVVEDWARGGPGAYPREFYDQLKAEGWITYVYRGYSAEPDDAELWHGPVPACLSGEEGA